MIKMGLRKTKKALAFLTALTVAIANVGVMPVVASASLAAGEYNAEVKATDVNTETYGVSNYFGGACEYEVAADGTVTLGYALASGPSTGTFSKTYYDAGVIYYKFDEADDWTEVPEEDMSYGSQRANAVKFQLQDTNVTEFYVKVDVYKRGSTLAAGTYHSVSDGVLSVAISQTATPTITAVEPSFKDTTSVSIECATAGATIYYTIDGVEKEYTEEFDIDNTTTITARATANKYLESEITTTTFRKSEADGFGAYNTVYEEGEHTVKVTAKTAGSTSASSYADFVQENATLIVDAENNAMIKIELLKGAMNKGFEFIGYVEEYRYYDSDKNIYYAEVLEYYEEESLTNPGTFPPKVVLIPILNKRATLLELRGTSAFVSDNALMPTYTSEHDFDIWILDFNEDNYVEPEAEPLPEVEDTGFLFGSTEKEILPGKYVVDAEFMKANDLTEPSMSQDAVYGDVILEVKEDGTANVSLSFGEMVYGGIGSNVSAVRYYTSDTPNSRYLVDAKINTTNMDGLLNNVTFNITNKALNGLYTNFDVLYIHENLDAYLDLNYETATVYEEPVYEELKTEEPDVYSKEDGGSLTLTIYGSYDEFVELRINDKLVPSTYYTVRNTSLISYGLARITAQESFEIELHEEILATLDAGVNEITVYTETGIATFDLEVAGGFLFGTDKVDLTPGKYTIDAQFLKANNFDEVSMSDDAVEGDYILEIAEDGTATVSMNFAPMNYSGFLASVSAVRYYTSDNIDVNYLVDAIVNTRDDAEMPNNVTLSISNNALDGLFVNFDVLYIHENLDAYLELDYASAELILEADIPTTDGDDVPTTDGDDVPTTDGDDAPTTSGDDDLATDNDPTSEDDTVSIDSADTGDNTPIALYFAVLMLSVLGLILIKRKSITK